ncbi:MAG: CPBP family intramembrane metalloprotease [Planctomycetes bacterium]|nr:CPBP family intramembrane metalloprotease [Planctomycetota bacterium]
MTEKGRPSAIQPAVKLERRVSPLFGLFFYGFIFFAAWVWVDRGLQTTAGALWASPQWARDIAVGVGGAALLCVATPLLVAVSPAARELEREFGWILGQQRAWEVAYLAVLSGAAEEFLFRGAMYEAMGPVASTAIFAAIHWPVNRSFRLWPVIALAAGIVLAAERAWTGNLVAPAVTHALVNAVNLWRITRKYRAWSEP